DDSGLSQSPFITPSSTGIQSSSVLSSSRSEANTTSSCDPLSLSNLTSSQANSSPTSSQSSLSDCYPSRAQAPWTVSPVLPGNHTIPVTVSGGAGGFAIRYHTQPTESMSGSLTQLTASKLVQTEESTAKKQSIGTDTVVAREVESSGRRNLNRRIYTFGKSVQPQESDDEDLLGPAPEVPPRSKKALKEPSIVMI
ncbi:unnamed protein product, partial [Protopolystoma xenopodis]